MPPHKLPPPPPHRPHDPPPYEPRRPGRPPSVGADTPLNVKISQAELLALDECAAHLEVSRAEAVRQSLRLLQDAVERNVRPSRPAINAGEPAINVGEPAVSADDLYAHLVILPSSITRQHLTVLLQSITLATSDSAACLYFLDCLRLYALGADGVLASREVAARFAGIIQARGGKGFQGKPAADTLEDGE